jgi:hypothetical protein
MNFRMAKSALVLAGIAAICATSLTPASAMEKPLPAVEQPLKPEHNPAGDIPDNQAFIDYASPLGFSIKVPQGWSRADRPDGVVFAEKYGRIAVTEVQARSAPDVATAQTTLVPDLERSARAVKITKVKGVKLPAGGAVLVSYGSNSDPSPVTNKAIRLEGDRYYFWKDGKLVMVDMSAPAGADNVDQWDLIAKSFRWQ